MIRINLLPKMFQESPLSSAASLPSLRIAGIVVLSFLAVYSVWLFVVNRLESMSLAKLTVEWNALQVQQPHLEQMEALVQLKGPEARWAPRLNLLSDALAPRVWFTSLKLGEVKPSLVTNAPPRGKGGVPVRSPVQVKEPASLLVKGSALAADAEGEVAVNRFLQQLKEHPEFNRWFRGLELKGYEQRQIHEEEVVDFSIVLYPTGT